MTKKKKLFEVMYAPRYYATDAYTAYLSITSVEG